MPVRQAIDGEFDRYIARHGVNLPKETIGVGEGFDFQLFDRTLLYSAETRFVLAGIVNRMDRTYAAEASCGEIRLIYRLTRMNKAAGDDASPPRLPMTLNLVLKARGEGSTITCSEVARLPTVEGWVLRDVANGSALIESRRGMYEVYAGDPIPGLGRVDAIRRQDGHWVVVTSKGLIVAR